MSSSRALGVSFPCQVTPSTFFFNFYFDVPTSATCGTMRNNFDDPRKGAPGMQHVVTLRVDGAQTYVWGFCQRYKMTEILAGWRARSLICFTPTKQYEGIHNSCVFGRFGWDRFLQDRLLRTYRPLFPMPTPHPTNSISFNLVNLFHYSKLQLMVLTKAKTWPFESLRRMP